MLVLEIEEMPGSPSFVIRYPPGFFCISKTDPSAAWNFNVATLPILGNLNLAVSRDLGAVCFASPPETEGVIGSADIGSTSVAAVVTGTLGCCTI
jgi:hypothetical protein